MFLKDLSIKYNKSIPTINKYFDILIEININKYNKNSNKIPVNLVFDATFFKRKWKREICFQNKQ